MSKAINWADNKPKITKISDSDLLVGKFGPNQTPSYVTISNLLDEKISDSIAKGRGYKIYNSSLTQESTNVPTENNFINELGLGTFSWARMASGRYRGTLNGLFTDESKVQIFMGSNHDYAASTLDGPDTGDGLVINAYPIDANTIEILTISNINFNQIDEVLKNTPIEIRVYS